MTAIHRLLRRAAGLVALGTLVLASSTFTRACSDEQAAEFDSAAVRATAASRVGWQASTRSAAGDTVRLQLLGINDFHGQLSGRRVANRPAGGAAVLASYLEAETAAFNGTTIIVHAGDHVGASPPNSSLLQDEPAITFLNYFANDACEDKYRLPQFPGGSVRLNPDCNMVGTFGNHEFDEGSAEALRLIYGGTHPNGPFLEPNFDGAHFPYVLSNVVFKSSKLPLVPPFVIKNVDGVKVAFLGAVLKETPTIVTPTGVAGLEFLDEADAINGYVTDLRKQGVRAFVVTIHQGGTQAGQTPSGAIVDLVKRFDADIDVVISGHTHSFMNALMPNAGGQPVLVTQAFSSSTAYDDVELTLDRTTGDVIQKSAVVNTTWGDTGPGLTPNTEIASLVRAADEKVAPLVNRVIAEAATALVRSENSAGESNLGNLIADAQRAAMGTDFAFMNPGGIRADLDAGTVTWGELFTIQPFGNSLVKLDLTGDQIYRLLEQQWKGQPFPRIMKTSGLTYAWDAARPVGSRIIEVRKGGVVIDRATTYTVTCNNFMAAGGDNYTVFTEGKNQLGGPIDLDALIAYVQALPQPFTATIEGRIQRLN